MTAPPSDMQLIGTEIAVRWPDGTEDYFPGEVLRAHSPSAENTGERDLFGKLHGGGGPRDFTGVRVLGWRAVGNYAVAFEFSDGHNTGLYSWKLLRELGVKLRHASG